VANRIALTAVFVLSFVTYLAPELSFSIQLIPWIAFAVLVYFQVGWCSSVLAAVGSLLTLDGLVFTLGLCPFIVGASYYSSSNVSLPFSLFLSACLILGRLYTAVVPIAEIVEAFFWSGVISCTLFVLMGFAFLQDAVAHLTRLSAFGFHPNLLAFVMAGYLTVMVWKIMTGRRFERLVAGPVAIACLGILFFASSRGIIVGVVVGCAAIALMAFLRADYLLRRRIIRLSVVGLPVAAVLVVVLWSQPWITSLYESVDTILALSTPDRGFGSGLTGRLDKWHELLTIFSDGTWLLGHGIRSSDSMEQLIDNSYLVTLYELGIIPAILICARFLLKLGLVVRGYLRRECPQQDGFLLFLALALTVLLVSNAFERMLFAVGNPFSLLAFLVFVAPFDKALPEPEALLRSRLLTVDN